MTDLIIIDDTLPIQGCHFLVRRGWPQIKTSIAGAHCLTDIISHEWAAVCCVLGVIEQASQHGETLSNVEALAHIANRRLKADLLTRELDE